VSQEEHSDPHPHYDPFGDQEVPVRISAGREIHPVYQRLDKENTVVYNHNDLADAGQHESGDIEAYEVKKDKLKSLLNENAHPVDFWNAVTDSLETSTRVEEYSPERNYSAIEHVDGWLEISEKNNEDAWITSSRSEEVLR
jgi:hypothetical protein